MLYGAEVVVCSQINTKHINTVWTKCIILKCETCWCAKPVGFKRLKWVTVTTWGYDNYYVPPGYGIVASNPVWG